jgi:hypothetical protein
MSRIKINKLKKWKALSRIDLSRHRNETGRRIKKFVANVLDVLKCEVLIGCATIEFVLTL